MFEQQELFPPVDTQTFVRCPSCGYTIKVSPNYKEEQALHEIVHRFVSQKWVVFDERPEFVSYVIPRETYGELRIEVKHKRARARDVRARARDVEW